MEPVAAIGRNVGTLMQYRVALGEQAATDGASPG